MYIEQGASSAADEKKGEQGFFKDCAWKDVWQERSSALLNADRRFLEAMWLPKPRARYLHKGEGLLVQTQHNNFKYEQDRHEEDMNSRYFLLITRTGTEDDLKSAPSRRVHRLLNKGKEESGQGFANEGGCNSGMAVSV